MRCPFLKEATVGCCEVSPFRKMVRRSSIHEDEQRCSSAAYVDCPAAREHLRGRTGLDRCPFFRESLVQYCAAAPVTKFIPLAEGLQGRCNSDAHRYCQLYLQRAHPERRSKRHPGVEPGMEEIPVPGGLAYSRNHMWLDVAGDGGWHVGVDAFLARVLGEVECVTFVSGKGVQMPSVVLTVRGVDLSLIFPCRVNVTRSNVLLRARPEALLADPYGSGWLFEGSDPEGAGGEGPHKAWCTLLRGKEAEAWMRDEADSMSMSVQELCSQRRHEGERLMADGGIFCSDVARHLDREELLRLFNHFFAPR